MGKAREVRLRIGLITCRTLARRRSLRLCAPRANVQDHPKAYSLLPLRHVSQSIPFLEMNLTMTLDYELAPRPPIVAPNPSRSFHTERAHAAALWSFELSLKALRIHGYERYVALLSPRAQYGPNYHIETLQSRNDRFLPSPRPTM